jgi:hypothetical protein
MITVTQDMSSLSLKMMRVTVINVSIDQYRAMRIRVHCLRDEVGTALRTEKRPAFLRNPTAG